MKIVTKQQSRALIILTVTVLLLEFFFGGTSVQIKAAYSDAQWKQVAASGGSCNDSSFGTFAGSVKIPHEICKNPKATTCGVISVGDAGHISTRCVAGCCQAAGYTNAQSAQQSFFGNLKNTLISQGVQTLVGKLFGGGEGSGGSYTGTTGIGFRDEIEEQEYLRFSNEDFGESGSESAPNLAFGTGRETEEKTTALTHTNDELETQAVAVAKTTENKEQSTPKDSVSTAYELRGDASIVRSTKPEVMSLSEEELFEQDLFGSSLSSAEDTLNPNGITIRQLERDALVARQREILLNEEAGIQGAGSIEDYRSSNVARSSDRVEVNPLSNTRYDALEYESEEIAPSWWHNLVLLVGQLFGAPTQ